MLIEIKNFSDIMDVLSYFASLPAICETRE